MKNEQVKYRFFTIFQYKQEEEFLRQQHNNGWRFTKLNALICYRFEKCEPQDVVYQLDYNPDGIAHKAEYVQMFRDCGWEYLQDYVGYSYFRKPTSEMNGDEEIFSDDSSRDDLLKQVINRRVRFLPLNDPTAWANAIAAASLRRDPEARRKAMEAGYDIHTSAGALQAFYLRRYAEVTP